MNPEQVSRIWQQAKGKPSVQIDVHIDGERFTITAKGNVTQADLDVLQNILDTLRPAT